MFTCLAGCEDVMSRKTVMPAQLSSTRVAIHSVIPIARKHFQLPSGSFLSTASTVPRTCVGWRPGDATNDAAKERHSTAPASQIVKSLVSGTKVNTLIGRVVERSLAARAEGYLPIPLAFACSMYA